jgi:hypothetical protein
VTRKDVADWAFELVAASEALHSLRVTDPCEEAVEGGLCWNWGADTANGEEAKFCPSCRVRFSRQQDVRAAKERRRMALRGLFRAVRRMRDGK